MENQQNTPRPPLSQIIIYAIGQFGWALASFGAANLLIYFYMPPEKGTEAIFPPYIFQGAIFGFVTIIGLVSFGGRIFDAITDPFIANWSDRRRSKFGKRKSLMGIATVPFALTSFLIFYPLSENASNINTIWLIGCIILFYLFFTIYLVPYNALISELGHDERDRVKISTIISIAFALGLIAGNSSYAMKDFFLKYYQPTQALQCAILICAVISMIAMLVPVIFLNENKYCKTSTVHIDTTQSLKSVFSNENFKWFVRAEFLYWLALSFIQIGVSFYVVTIYLLPSSYATQFLMISFFFSFLFYYHVNKAAKSLGKKTVLSLAFIVFAITFLLLILTYFTSDSSIKLKMFYFTAMLSGFPLAAFGIIPNVIVADVIHEHEEKTGQNLAGMFYGARNLFMKLGISTANLIFPSLLLLGKSSDNASGILATTIVAVGFMISGFLIFQKYGERRA